MPVDMKALIAETLQKMAQKGNIDKITVKSLIEECHISRQTFYYHFQDIMDVMEWSVFVPLVYRVVRLRVVGAMPWPVYSYTRSPSKVSRGLSSPSR